MMKTTYGLPKKREEVLEVLQSAFTQGHLDEREYERRVSNAYEAQSIEELEPVLADFPPPIRARVFAYTPQARPLITEGGTSLPTQQPYSAYPAASQQVYRVALAEENATVGRIDERTLKISTLLGAQKLDFSQAQVATSHSIMQVECYLGETRINLLNEQLAGKHVEVHIIGGMGEIQLLVPRSAQVERRLQLMGGDFKIRNKRSDLLDFFRKTPTTYPDFPLSISIHGAFYFGSVRVLRCT